MLKNNLKTRFWLGFIVVLSVVVFTWANVHIQMNHANSVIEELRMRKQEAIERENKAIQQRDSARLQRNIISYRLVELNKEIEKNNSKMQELTEDYLSNKKNLKDERFNIPDITTNEQYEFLSNYKFEE